MPVGSPATYPAGGAFTSAFWNVEVRDQFNDFLGSWTPYTPAWTATTTNPSGYTSYGRYISIGKTVIVNTQFAVSGAATGFGSGSYTFGLPVPCSQVAALQLGNGRATTGNGVYVVTLPLILAGYSKVFQINAPGSATSNSLVTVGSSGLAGTPWSATGWSINNTIVYEAA